MQFETQRQPFAQHHDLTSPSHYIHESTYPIQHGEIKTEPSTDIGLTHSQLSEVARYQPQPPPHQQHPQQQYQQGFAGVNDGLRFPSPNKMQAQIPFMNNGYSPNASDSTDEYTRAQLQALQSHQDTMGQPSSARTSTGSAGSLCKPFSCSTCEKGFARRSDLARHERIHSGVRPHVCDFPECGKQFIQRSALTVHSRVHTGEKPHMCECCAKHFSDSSSLARHRRIHSGKRPYKCPYGNCQKTFTRRTTLIRHQNHHTGSVEQSVRDTEATLASRAPTRRPKHSSDNSDMSESLSGGASPHGMISNQQAFERSLSNVESQQRQSDYYMHALNNGMHNMPPHMRSEVASQTSRSSTPANVRQSYGQVSSNRSSMASHAPLPSAQMIEANQINGSHENSVVPSPSVTVSGWHSPANAPTPISQAQDYQSYPDPHTQQYVQNAQNMYYQNTTTDSIHRLSQDMWAGHQQ